MNNKDNILIGAVAFVFLAIVVWIFANSREEVDWTVRLDQEEYQPYDLGYLKTILDKSSNKEFTVNQEKLEKVLKETKSANYILISQNSHFSKKELKALKKFVDKGNDAFIAVNYLDENLDAFLNFAYIETAKWDSSYQMQLNATENKVFPFRFYNKKGLVKRPFNYFNFIDKESDLDFESLGSFQKWAEWKAGNAYSYCNYVRVKWGKGNFYVHTNPVLFSNYHLQSKKGLAYINGVLSPLENKNILWDEYTSYYHFDPDSPPNSGDEDQRETSSPLKFVLEHKALKYAWYTLLLGILIFLLFRSKRRQTQIPIIPQVENTSLEFSKSLGALYIQNGSGKSLAIELMSQFDNYNRRRFRINRQQKDKDAAKLISDKSRVNIQLIQKILLLERKIIYNPNSSAKEVVPLYDAIKEYYNKSIK